MQRTLGTILVAVLVVFAGCNGVLGSGSDEPDIRFTPVPVPTDKPTPTPVPQLAPGLTRQGIEYVYPLLAATESFYRNRSFTIRANYTALASNGSVLTSGTTVIHVGPPGTGVHSIPKRDENKDYSHSKTNPIRTEWWSGGKRVFFKQTYKNGTMAYDQARIDVGSFRSGLVHGRLPYFLESSGPANTSVTKRITRSGTTLYRVQGTGWNDVWGNVVNLKLLVDSSGVIHEYRTAYRVSSEYPEPSEKNVSKVVIEREFSKIGATDAPERPSWVDEAMNQTTPIPGETTVRNY